MKKFCVKILALMLVLVMVLPLAACGNDPDPVKDPIDPSALFHALLEQVKYDTTLEDAGTSAAYIFEDLPEYALVTMYSGSAYYADELVWITLATAGDMEQAMASVEKHLEQVHNQFLSYIPEEVDKIDNAQIWNEGINIIVCVTNDYENAAQIIKNAHLLEGNGTQNTQDNTQEVTTTEEPTEEQTTEEPTEPPTEPATIPTLTSNSGKYKEYSAAYIVDNAAYEKYNYSKSAAEYYTSLVNKTAEALSGQAKVYCLVIPTAIGITFPDDVAEKNPGLREDQGARIDEIMGMLDSSVTAVDCYENMMLHRDEYLYFRTDWHWNGIGAYYAYESFCQAKGVPAYTMEQRRESVFEGYLGPMYTQTCKKDAALKEKPDTVYAYHPYHEGVEMYYTDKNGNRVKWNVIQDMSNAGSGMKYLTFAAGDQPFAEFYNPGVTDGSVAIVVKESYGNAMLSYFVDHYSTVYEIDYRYWEGDLIAFAKEKGADEIIFANNIGMVRSSYLIGLLDRIV